jgi:phosphoribosyl 1,2-cyclic phosphodiesterase
MQLSRKSILLNFRTIASSSAGCCYVVQDGKSAPLMIECGLPLAQIRRALPYTLSSLAGCVVSHRHLDHCKAAKAMTAAGVDVYASRPTLDAIATDRPYRTHDLTEGKWSLLDGGWQVLPFGVEHDVEGAIGVVVCSPDGVDKLLYITDTCFSRHAFNGLTMIAAEANHSEEIMRANVDAGVIEPERFARTLRSHMSIERLEGFLASCDLSTVHEIHLLHLSSVNSDAAAFRSRIERRFGIPVTVAGERS